VQGSEGTSTRLFLRAKTNSNAAERAQEEIRRRAAF
jgi:hypothetical protein